MEPGAQAIEGEVSTVIPAEDGTFRPYIPAEASLPELSVIPLILGVFLGMVFGASSLYLVLKVGLTVSASIPVAVISITVFNLLSRLGFKNTSILENNIVQTAGSAGESLAFGIGVTMPAIMILGFNLEITRVILVGILGGLLGILMMIPLRRALIVRQHGQLKYPEGTACAEVLKAGASLESRQVAGLLPADGKSGSAVVMDSRHATLGALTIFSGFGIGFVYYVLEEVFRTWKDTAAKVFGNPLRGASASIEVNPALLGVGYIIGPKISAAMAGGGVLAYLVLIPLIGYFGSHAVGPIAPGTVPIRQMGPEDIHGTYVLYIGAGAVAAGGIISLVRSLPMIWGSLRAGLSNLRAAAGSLGGRQRTDRDLPMGLVVGGIGAVVVLITLARPLHMNLLGALLIVIFGFLFVTVSSRLTGEIGSSSNPVSGMTVATLLLTSLLFLLMGWTSPAYYVTALSVGAIVCIAAGNAGATSQDLKTGYLVGSTPRYQQIAILLGALASALVLGPILLQLNAAGTVYVPQVTVQHTAGPAGRVGVQRQVNFPATLRANLSDLGPRATLQGPQALSDHHVYRTWQNTNPAVGPEGEYLVNAAGVPVYLVDPGINGRFDTRPDGSHVTKFSAPKAVLMSYIIKGILSRQLPWGLVLVGALIAIVLEMSGIPSLAFAVGVYLPLSSSTPILAGGLVRWFADRHTARRLAHRNLTPEELAAEYDKSPGVLLASGYIAGGALAGIIIAFVAGSLDRFSEQINTWMTLHNPFYGGPWADALTLIPFGVLALILYAFGRRSATDAPPLSS